MTMSKHFGCIILLILATTMISGCLWDYPSDSAPTPVDYRLLKSDHFDQTIHFRSTSRWHGGSFNQYTFILPDGKSTYHVFADLPSRSVIRVSASTGYSINSSSTDRYGITYSLTSGSGQNLGWVSHNEGPINSTISFPTDAISPSITFYGYNEPDIDVIVKIDKVT